MGGRRKVQVPLDLACRMYRRRNPGSLQGWGRRYHNKRTCVLPRVRGAPPALRSRPPEPGLCLSYREGTALGAPLAGEERLTHLKGNGVGAEGSQTGCGVGGVCDNLVLAERSGSGFTWPAALEINLSLGDWRASSSATRSRGV
ncbi:unnamed protein product [Rangifer tarandus platyrhynchus]|uniref:Uncharacterized protein n=2 Tax=Rangifer tarandus platyrhynchus TaxID=3082113 RepID=A0ACB0FAT3_RANTA|nr:unnamed protein product [Rangifer tarandus platyrhynchus]CAI9709809.1 unnamed protein product [Rangifer tarandus platyrhynchus]